MNVVKNEISMFSLINGTCTLPDTETETETDIEPIKWAQNPMGICVVWTPQHNYIQATYISIYARSVWETTCGGQFGPGWGKMLTIRNHSSRMHTARFLTVSPSIRLGRGVCAGGAGSGGVCLGVCLGGCLPRGCACVCLGGCLPRGCLPLVQGGRPLVWGVSATPPGPEADTPQVDNPALSSACWDALPCGQTDTCKNIIFANFVCGQ